MGRKRKRVRGEKRNTHHTLSVVLARIRQTLVSGIKKQSEISSKKQRCEDSVETNTSMWQNSPSKPSGHWQMKSPT